MEVEYALNTLYMLITAALVMWMAAGFTMLEAGHLHLWFDARGGVQPSIY